MSLEATIRARAGELDLDVALDAPTGETLAVVGPNGAGKTTALRVLAGLVPVAAGRVAVDGVVLEDTAAGVRLAPEARPIGVVFQDLLLFPHLSVVDNVAFGLRARGARTAAARAAAGRWLERLGVADLAAAAPATLSGGQAQRVAIARALATSPRLLLLDEPLAALDAPSRRELRRELRHALAGAAGTRVVVTHDPLEAAVLGDRIAVVEEGRVVQAGPAAEVAARPRSRFAAQLADLNLLRGTASGTTVTLAGGQSVVVADAEQGEVFLAVRPAAVAVHHERPAGSPRNVWPGTVAHVDHEPGRARVQVDGPVPLAAAVTPAAVAELGLAPGAAVWVAVKANEVDVYPA